MNKTTHRQVAAVVVKKLRNAALIHGDQVLIAHLLPGNPLLLTQWIAAAQGDHPRSIMDEILFRLSGRQFIEELITCQDNIQHILLKLFQQLMIAKLKAAHTYRRILCHVGVNIRLDQRILIKAQTDLQFPDQPAVNVLHGLNGLIPISGAMGRKAGVKLSRIYMALAFFASVGGTLTLIGAGNHVVAQGFLEKAGMEGFTFFEFTPLGLPIAIAGFLYMYFFGIKLLPERDIPTEKDVALADRKPAKMIIVALVFLFIVYCMASGLLAMHLAAAVGAILVVLTGCISVEDAVKQFSVSTLFLVAGIFPLSTAMSSSGAAEYIISSLSSNLSNLPPIAVLAFTFALAVVGTQFMMGTSLTAILTPIAILIGQTCNVDPHALVMCVALGTSAAFCTPFGTGPNLLV